MLLGLSWESLLLLVKPTHTPKKKKKIKGNILKIIGQSNLPILNRVGTFMHWNNCWSNSFKPLDKQFLNKTYLVDDIFRHFFYENVFSPFLEKREKLKKRIDKENIPEKVKLDCEEVKIIEQRALIKELQSLLKTAFAKKTVSVIHRRRLKKELSSSDTKDLRILELLIEIKNIEVDIEVSKLKVVELSKKTEDYYKNIEVSSDKIKSISCIIMTESRKRLAESNLFPLETLKEAKKKINFLKDATRLYQAPPLKKSLGKKENYNFSRVWFVKFNKFVLITMFSYFYLRVKAWRRKKRFNFKKKRFKDPAIFVWFAKKSGLNQKRDVFNNYMKKDFFLF